MQLDTYLANLDSPEPPSGVPSKTRSDLEWDAVLEALSARCDSEWAAALAHRLPILGDSSDVELRLQEVLDVRLLTDTGDLPSLVGLTDVTESLSLARRGGVLDGLALASIARLAEVGGVVGAFFSHQPQALATLCKWSEGLVDLGWLAKALFAAIGPGGEILDRASPELGSLRRRVVSLREQVQRIAEGYLKDWDFEELLQDRAFRLREGRFVLPIRVGEQGRVPGIVHGRSGSGQTVFIEPNELVEQNNKLALAELEVEREESLVLARLTGEVANQADDVLGNTHLLLYLDLTLAAARLARDMGATKPTLTARTIALRRARHPLLALRESQTEGTFEAVPNDLGIGPGDDSAAGGLNGGHALLISGPNTGGKTVALKTIGLCALMTRAGLLIPCEEDSHLPLFAEVFSDIGDEQSIADDLSSFSAHLRVIGRFLPDVGPASLVLLDEVFSGTDPVQGAALASALLERLVDRGALVAATTHFQGLKLHALNHPRFDSASMGFDLARLSPTFQMQMGLPGSSYAIGIARRMGFPEPVVGRAEALVDREGQSDLDGMLSEIQRIRSRLETREREAALQIAEAEAERARLQRERERLKGEALAAVDEELQAVFEQIREAEMLVRRRRKELLQPPARKRVDEQALTDTQTELKRVKSELQALEASRKRAAVSKERPPLALSELSPDLEVWVAPFKRPGIVLEVDSAREQVMVRVGAMKATFGPGDLFGLQPSESEWQDPRPKPRAQAAGAPRPTPKDRTIAPQNPGNTLDLRGLRVDECADALDRFLDAAYRKREPGVYVIHGHGTGALKAAVRAHLSDSAYVASFRPGERGEGGDGVTVVLLD